MIIRRMVLASLVSITLGVISLGIISSYAMSWDEQIHHNYDSKLWDLGDNITEGDLFHYRICDGDIPDTYMESTCYDMSLIFVSLLESSSGIVWIVQGELTVGEEVHPMILQINPETFQVKTDKSNIPLGDSLERTIFNLSHYKPISLSIGTQWDDVESYFTNNVPLEITRQEILDENIYTQTSVLNYEVITPSDIWISKEFPFPVKANVYSPHIIFPEPEESYYFELTEYSINDDSIQADSCESEIFLTEEEFGEYLAKTNPIDNHNVNHDEDHEHLEDFDVVQIYNSTDSLTEEFTETFETDYEEDYTIEEYFEKYPEAEEYLTDEYIPVNPEDGQ